MRFADFRPIRLFFCLALALMLYGSFQWIGETRSLWDIVDDNVFYALNGSLKHNIVWAYFWAIGNNEIFDLLAFLFMLGLAYQYVMGSDGEQLNRRVAHFLYMAIIIVLNVAVLDRLLNITLERGSPTVVFQDGFMLSSIATWFHAKDISYNSYPSDHGIVLITFTLLLWHFAGSRKGRIMLAGAVFFCLPRLFGGAHWFTDMVCGSLPLALVAFAIGVYTPLKGFIIHWLHRFTELSFVSAAIRLFFHRETPLLLAKGMGMGSADVVPGVSGGTIAYITHVWDRLMDAIDSINTAWLKLVFKGQWTEALRNPHLAFAVPLVIGVGVAFITFSRFIPLPVLMQLHPEPVYGMFFGLIIGSILLLLIELGRLSLADYFWIAIGTGAGWLLVNLVPVETPNDLWFIFLCGCIAISAMLLPGISGSFILLVLGKYTYILEALGKLDFTIILPFILGCVTGLFTFARAASWLVHHHYRISVTSITGILIGSLWLIWPFQHREYIVTGENERILSATPTLPATFTADVALALGLGMAGLVIVLWIGLAAVRKARMLKTTLPVTI